MHFHHSSSSSKSSIHPLLPHCLLSQELQIYLPVSIYMYEFSLLCHIFLSFIHLSELLFYRQLEIFTSLVIIFQVSVFPAFLCPDHLPKIVHLLRIWLLTNQGHSPLLNEEYKLEVI